MTALITLAADYGLDPDDYPTWVGLAEALDPLMAEASDEFDADEPDEAPTRRSSKQTLSQEELEALPVPELRQLAKQLGVEGWDKNRSAKLIDGVIAAQEGGATRSRGADDDGDEGGQEASDNWLIAVLAKGLRAFADAIER